MRASRQWCRRIVVLGALTLGLGGCVVYAPPGYYAAAPGYYPATYYAPAYYGPPIYGSIGFVFGGHGRRR
jgi:hypothetical protein